MGGGGNKGEDIELKVKVKMDRDGGWGRDGAGSDRSLSLVPGRLAVNPCNFLRVSLLFWGIWAHTCC